MKRYKENSALEIVNMTGNTSIHVKDLKRGDIYLRNGAVVMVMECSNEIKVSAELVSPVLIANLGTGRVWYISGEETVLDLIHDAKLTFSTK